MSGNTISTRELQNLLLRSGFKLVRVKGGHKIYDRNGTTVVVNRKINKMVARRIIKENHLKED